MGTSTSFRAPSRTRWQIFAASLSSKASLDRICTELFHAGDEWAEALAQPAVASYAASLVELHQTLPAQLADLPSSTSALSEALSNARLASRMAGFSAATPIADRAFASVLLAATEIASGAPASPSQEATLLGASTWQGDSARVARQFAVETVSEFARHVVDREAGALASKGQGATESAELTESLVDRVRKIADRVASEQFRGGALRAEWAGFVDATFADGGRLPEDRT